MIVDIPSGARVTIAVEGVALSHSISLNGDQWHANVVTKTPSRHRSPWDYMDDGPTGPEIRTANLTEAVTWVRETAAAHLAEQQAERDAEDAERERAEKERRNAKRRAARARAPRNT